MKISPRLSSEGYPRVVSSHGKGGPNTDLGTVFPRYNGLGTAEVRIWSTGLKGPRYVDRGMVTEVLNLGRLTVVAEVLYLDLPN